MLQIKINKMYSEAYDDRSVDQIKANIAGFRNQLQQHIQQFRTQSTIRINAKKEQHIKDIQQTNQLHKDKHNSKLLLIKKQPFATAMPKPRFFVEPNTMLCKPLYLDEKEVIQATSTDKFSNSKHSWKYTPTKMDYLTNLFGYRLSAPNQKRKSSLTNAVKMTKMGEDMVQAAEDKYMSLVSIEAQLNSNKLSGVYKKQSIEQAQSAQPKRWSKVKLIGGAFSNYKYESQKFLDWRERGKVVGLSKTAEHRLWRPVKAYPTFF